MAIHIETVLRKKTALKIVARCYEVDKSAAIGPDGLFVHGNSIRVATVHDKEKGRYHVTIFSSVHEQSTLKSLVSEVFAAIKAERMEKVN